MTRRPAPTPLRLVQGPLPVRSKPKHTLPSFPRPCFYPSAPITSGPAPRARAPASELDEILPRPGPTQLPPPILPVERASRSDASSPSSAGSWSSVGSAGSGHERAASSGSWAGEERVLRGPWDHSASIRVPMDLNAMLAPPRPAAVNPAPVW